jgi:elongation factor P
LRQSTDVLASPFGARLADRLARAATQALPYEKNVLYKARALSPARTLLQAQSPMSKVAGNEVRPGMVITHNGQLWSVVKTQSVKPGKGGAYNQVELKNIISGSKLNERFRSAETVEEVQLERRDFQFLYASGDTLTFMDMLTYDQIELESDFVGERVNFLQDGMKVIMQMHEARPIGISLPQHVVLTVTEADPVVKGQTAASSYKSAMLENGVRTQVPPFIEAGTRVIVSTDDGSYVKRAD